MQTKIYYACIKPLEDVSLYRRLYDAASRQRKEKTDRFRFQKDRALSVGAEALLRYALRENGYFPSCLNYSYGMNGKPFLPDFRFFFNLSHAGKYVLLAVSDTEIGCDIEEIRPVNFRLAKRVLTADEYAAFRACAEEERDATFFRYWVCKESCMKATGKGLLTDPASIRIKFGSPTRACGEALTEPYAIWEGNDISGYRYAVCRAGDPIQVQTKITHLDEIEGGNDNDNREIR